MCPVTDNTIVALVVSIGGAPARVVSSVLAPRFAGVYQINVQIPSLRRLAATCQSHSWSRGSTTVSYHLDPKLDVL
jgi:uncharacterized protein (TIGR03437 family)